ncbi:MAG TPA: hypothetical protein PLR24_11480, partial [Saprospiraceae bacterium]|nr:hypothetical protein [Saprospiraceae bacterium]
KRAADFPYRMPLWPLPAILAIVIWLLLFVATGMKLMISGVMVIATGLVIYLVKARIAGDWPFKRIV